MVRLIEWVKNFREGSINPKVDEVRGIFPYLSNSGYANVTSNGLFTSILLVPSSKRFILKGFWVNNSAEANFFVLYDGVSASVGLVTMPPYQVAQSKTDIISGLNYVFQTGVFISTGTSTVTIKIWGLLVNSEAV